MKTLIKSFLIIAIGTLIYSCSNDDNPIVNVEPPVANFTFEILQDNSQLVSFTNTSENAQTFEWNFGDGTEESHEKHPSHYYLSGGSYTVKLTVMNEGGSESFSMDIEVKDVAPDYDNLYIVGDSSPSGWNIASPETFTQDSSNPFVFTYEALLTPGVFKISTFTGDWCDGDWINSPNDGDDLSSNQFIITNGCDGPDNKWTVTSRNEGNYLITVNLSDETIKFELQ